MINESVILLLWHRPEIRRQMTKRNTNLAKYFPMIRAREDIFHEIQENPSLKKKFEEWDEGEQKRFLDMCTGERASCYSADLLLRQYKRIREQSTREKFSYRNIKDVYTIIFFEKSTEVFHAFYENGDLNKNENANRKALIHRLKQQSDTGIQIELLQKFIFIPLDIFNKVYQNKPIDTKLAAWLTFLSTDQPERIAKLVEGYPEFRPLYEDLYNMCRNVERVMDMYSRELAELDKNTVHLMIDEYREENEKNKQIIARMGEQLTEKDKELTEKDKELIEKDRRIKELTAMLKGNNVKKEE